MNRNYIQALLMNEQEKLYSLLQRRGECIVAKVARRTIQRYEKMLDPCDTCPWRSEPANCKVCKEKEVPE